LNEELLRDVSIKLFNGLFIKPLKLFKSHDKLIFELDFCRDRIAVDREVLQGWKLTQDFNGFVFVEDFVVEKTKGRDALEFFQRVHYQDEVPIQPKLL
jgi:hypothetical protein